ncbi:MAG: response regulator [Candidatus Peregrinibacteria bacterium]
MSIFSIAIGVILGGVVLFFLAPLGAKMREESEQRKKNRQLRAIKEFLDMPPVPQPPTREELERRDMKNAYVVIIGSKKNLLIHDIIRWILERHDNIAIEVAETASEAQMKIKRRKPNLVIADMNPDGMDGLRLLIEIQNKLGKETWYFLLNVEGSEQTKKCYKANIIPISNKIKRMNMDGLDDVSLNLMVFLKSIKEQLCEQISHLTSTILDADQLERFIKHWKGKGKTEEEIEPLLREYEHRVLTNEQPTPEQLAQSKKESEAYLRDVYGLTDEEIQELWKQQN